MKDSMARFTATVIEDPRIAKQYGCIARLPVDTTQFNIGNVLYKTNYLYYSKELGWVKSMSFVTVFDTDESAKESMQKAGLAESEMEKVQFVKVEQTIRVLAEPISEYYNDMHIHCSDGDLPIAKHVVDESEQVSDFINTQGDWIKSHTRDEVYAKLHAIF